MKILMLTDKMELGGAETHIFTLISALLRIGHKVTLVSAGGDLADRLTREFSVPHLSVPLDSKNPFRLIFCYLRLSRLIKKGKFDLMHSHARLPSFISSYLSRRHKIPLICTAHARFFAKGFRKRLSRWGDLSIAVSEDLKQYLIESYGIAPENIFVIPNGINTRIFSPTTQSSSVIRIGFLSRLDSDCSLGARLLCELAPQIRKDLGRIEIMIGGGGSAYSEISALADRANKNAGYKCIRLLGKIDPKDTPSFFSSCHIFVGVSRAAIEAAASGASVILCGNEGYFGHLSAERFYTALDSNFCARGHRKPTAELLLRDIITAGDIESQRLRALIYSELGDEKMARATEEVYLRVLDSRTSRSPDVLLCGYYGYGNMGDDALLRSAISRVRTRFPHLSVGALTIRKRSSSRVFLIRCISRYSPLSLFRALASCKYFIFGGGTLLQSSTSLRSLLYYSLVFRLAKLFGARCYLWANGIGELSSPLARHLARRVLKKCDYIGLRDKLSAKKARELAPSCNAILEADLATELPPADPHRIRYLLRQALATDDLPPFVIAAPKNGKGILELEGALFEARENGFSICFVAMHKSEDRAITQRLCKKLGGIILDSITYSDLVGISAFSAGVFSMRLHALIAARSAGVPYKAFGDDEKLKNI